MIQTREGDRSSWEGRPKATRNKGSRLPGGGNMTSVEGAGHKGVSWPHPCGPQTSFFPRDIPLPDPIPALRGYCSSPFLSRKHCSHSSEGIPTLSQAKFCSIHEMKFLTTILTQVTILVSLTTFCWLKSCLTTILTNWLVLTTIVNTKL